MAATYEPIATQTLSSAQTSITFSSIAASWTDLRLVLVASSVGIYDYNLFIALNSITSGYSKTRLSGNGTAASSGNATGETKWNLYNGTGLKSTPSLWTLDIFSYAGSTFKTALSTNSNDYNGSGATGVVVHLCQSTAAVTQLVITNDDPNNFAIGTTATLYGIKAA